MGALEGKAQETTVRAKTREDGFKPVARNVATSITPTLSIGASLYSTLNVTEVVTCMVMSCGGRPLASKANTRSSGLPMRGAS